eukprot:scaffold320580_cov182-Cyclotella_meneghiniana.AAC.3
MHCPASFWTKRQNQIQRNERGGSESHHTMAKDEQHHIKDGKRSWFCHPEDRRYDGKIKLNCSSIALVFAFV